MKKLDWYLIRTFLGTFVYAMALIIVIVIVFDISERIDDFIEKEAPLRGIIFDYYVNFVPFFVNMFSALFTFIAVVFFTSRMAANSEIVAVLSSGISFRRMLIPYLICAILIGFLNVYLANFLIPSVNKTRIEFERKYVRNPYYNRDRDIHIQYDSTTFYYVENFDVYTQSGTRFSFEEFSPQGGLVQKISAESARFDSVSNQWSLRNYHVRKLDSLGENVERGLQKIFDFPLRPNDFFRDYYNTATMNRGELKAFIEQEKIRGSSQIKAFQYEERMRFSHPFAALVLTLIGVSFSSRKTRGGTGFHIAIGLMIAFLFILFLQFSRVFATFGSFPVGLAAWFPIFLFGLIALVLLRIAPK